MDKPYFINIDVELTSKKCLLAIEHELAGNVSVMASGKVGDVYQFNFECILPSESVGGPHTILEAVINPLESLSDGAKQTLLYCEKRVIDIGFNSGVFGWSIIPILACLSEHLSNIRVKTKQHQKLAGKSTWVRMDWLACK